MIVLDSTTDNLQAVLVGNVTTNQLRCMSCWRLINATDTYTAGRTPVNTNNTTDVNIVPAPTYGLQRVCDFISIFNADTVAATVTVKLDANGTEYELVKASLATGERLQYTNDSGFQVFTAAGALKQSQVAPVQSGLNVVVLGGDVTNNNATPNTIADVTGLSFPVVAGQTYWFEFVIPYTSAATTTGSRWSINGPANPTMLAYRSEYTLTATSLTVNCATAYDIPAASSASSLTTGNVATIWGEITPSSDGTVIARFASEITVSAIVAKAGAVVRYMRVA